MANFSDHISQAKKNLSFLHIINETANTHWDWQVTTCFYTGVHLINAYLADVADMHFENHTDTLKAISPNKKGNKIAISESCYLAYRKLFNDSIRSRYLCIHSEDKTSDFNNKVAYLTHDKHFQRAIKNLDLLIDFIAQKYNVTFPNHSLDCIEMKKKSYKFFEYKQKVTIT